MKRVNLLALVMFAFCSVFTSCDSDSDKPAEIKNHIKVGATEYENIHLMVAYEGVRGESTSENYPLRIYLYDTNIVYSNKSGLVENAFAHIRMDVRVEANGIPTEGTYTFDSKSKEVLSINGALQSTKQLGTQLIPFTDDLDRIVDKYEGADISKLTLKVSHADDNQYEFDLQATDQQGNEIKAYFKGVVGRTMLYE